MMKNETEESQALLAKACDENEEHMRIMRMIGEAHVVCGANQTTEENSATMSCCDSYLGDYSYVGPNASELLYVAKRGNVEEVVFMINHFAELNGVDERFLPPLVQEIIARRNNKTEVQALMKYYGFCSDVQLIMLKEWCMDDLRWYIGFHGFDCRGQRYILNHWDKEDVLMYFSLHNLDHWAKDALIYRNDHDIIMCFIKNNFISSYDVDIIFERGNYDEIVLAFERASYGIDVKVQEAIFERGSTEVKQKYITFFKWDDKFVNLMFDELDNGGLEDELLYYIDHHELSVACQKRMLHLVSTEFFKTYISKYGLWEDVHEVLLLKRSDDEVRLYLEKHPSLSNEAEVMFFANASDDNKMFYVETRERPNLHHLTVLVKQRPIDYELLTAAFLKQQYKFPRSSEISRSSYDRVRIIVGSGRKLSSTEVAALFFRNEPELFETYISIHDVSFD